MPQDRLETIAGSVQEQTVLKGTASEHTGVVLRTDDGRQFTLQRIGGNPFSDDHTRSLAGRSVTLSGYSLGSLFRYVDVSDQEGRPTAATRRVSKARAASRKR
jgi:hypothetical protein